MNFDSLIGNDRIKETLSVLLASGRFPHAVVLEGGDGMGKHTLAVNIARALVCRGDDKPCGKCSQCSKAVQNIHPDIFDYSPEGGARSFHIDTIRQVINDCALQPNEAQYKVYILCNAHLMWEPAQNALLKILEEPPSYAVFILTTVSKSRLLPTLLSRSVVLTLEGVRPSEGAAYIADAVDSVSAADAENALIMTGGNIGKAIKNLTDGKTDEIMTACSNICKGIVSDNDYDLLKACSVLQNDKQSILSACEILKQIFRDALLISQGCKNVRNSVDSGVLARSLTSSKLLLLINTTDVIIQDVLMNMNNALALTKLCCAFRSAVYE